MEIYLEIFMTFSTCIVATGSLMTKVVDSGCRTRRYSF